MIGVWRGLKIAIFERFSVPYSVAFPHKHVVHVNRDPNIAGSIGYIFIDIFIYDEVIGFLIPILDIVNTRSFNRRKIKFNIVIFKIIAPGLNVASECFSR